MLSKELSTRRQWYVTFDIKEDERSLFFVAASIKTHEGGIKIPFFSSLHFSTREQAEEWLVQFHWEAG